MAFVQINDLYFTYPGQSAPTLAGIHLTVQQGEFVVLCGPSGCGKTTLLRHLKAELQPVGNLKSEILYRGQAFSKYEPTELARQIGIVQQDPENQIVMEQVLQELAFGLENTNMPTDQMRRRIAEMAHFFGLENWLHRKTHTLSGGQKQIMNLAALLLLRPNLLLLDEPTAQLDPVAAKDFLQMLKRLNEEFGITVIVSEHRLEELFPIADRVVMLDKKGQIKYNGSPQEVISLIQADADREYFGYLPSMAKLFLSLQGVPQTVPLTVREGRAWLQEGAGVPACWDSATACRSASAEQAIDKFVLECRELSFGYGRGGQPILRQLDLRVHDNDFLAIVGGNGAGKSTLLQLMAGLVRAHQGFVHFRGKDIRKVRDSELHGSIGYLSQNPLAYFMYDTVEEELRQASARSSHADADKQYSELVTLLNLESILGMHPHDISGGERQKAALACILLARPQVVLLDEPTKGLDPLMKQAWGELLQTLHQQGLTIVLVTHDIEFAAQYVKRCAMLFDGSITSIGAPAPFFGENYFYTTVINRLVRDYFPEALTYEEVLNKWLEPASPF